MTDVSLLSDISAQKENGFADVVVDNNKLVPGCSLNNHHCDENYFQLRRFLSGTEGSEENICIGSQADIVRGGHGNKIMRGDFCGNTLH